MSDLKTQFTQFSNYRAPGPPDVSPVQSRDKKAGLTANKMPNKNTSKSVVNVAKNVPASESFELKLDQTQETAVRDVDPLANNEAIRLSPRMDVVAFESTFDTDKSLTRFQAQEEKIESQNRTRSKDSTDEETDGFDCTICG